MPASLLRVALQIIALCTPSPLTLCRFVRYDNLFSALLAVRKLKGMRWAANAAAISVAWSRSPSGKVCHFSLCVVHAFLG